MPSLPQPRGPLTGQLLSALAGDLHALDGHPPLPTAPLADDDFQLALYVCYELHYRGFDELSDAVEWSPELLAWRARLERHFEDALAQAVGAPPEPPPAAEMDLALRAIADADDGPSLSRHVERTASVEQVREFVMHRSAYQLKESDPHAWAVPRIHGPPKAALVEILHDEFGGGDPARVHASLFADAMDALGLDARYGAYLDRLPGVTLATVNLMSLLGLHRRHRGAICGHLALFEMTSSIPNRRYAAGLRRLGYDGTATAFFDEHVLADAVHENIAAVDLAGGLARTAPALGASILWGALALDHVEREWASHLLGSWDAGRSSLLPVPERAAV